MAATRQHERQQGRHGSPRARESHNGDERSDYSQVRRLMDVLLLLSRSGPQSADELGEKFRLSARSINRFLNVMQEAGWPVYMRKDNTTAKGLWAFEIEALLARFAPRKGDR